MNYEEIDWKVGVIESKYPIIIRARSSLPDQSNRKKFRHLIKVTWMYTCSERGMPDELSKKEVLVFEDKLRKELSANKIGFLAATITGKAQKEWRFYNSNAEKFMTALNKISDPKKPFPIDLQLFDDPTWQGLSEFI